MADNFNLKAVISAKAEALFKTLKEVNRATRTTRKYLLDVGSATANLGSRVGLPLAAVTGILGGFSFAAIRNAVVSFTDLGEVIYKSSRRAGMSVEQIQRMRYVAEQAGVSAEALEGGIGKLNRKLGEAAGKDKDLAGLLARLKIDMRDSNGQLKAGVDLLPQLADAFQRNQNAVVRARMGTALFGKAWQEMVPILEQGGEGIADSLKRLERLRGAGVMDEATIRGAKELGDKFNDLAWVTKGFQMTVAKELAPVITPLVEDLVQWAAANRQIVASEIKAFVRGLVADLKQVDWAGMVAGAKAFFAALGGLVDMVGGTRNALILLAVVMNAQTIMATLGLIGATGKLVWWLGTLAVSSVPAAIGALGTLGTSLAATGTAASSLIGLLGQLAAVAAAGAAGYAVGTALNEYVVNPLTQKLTGQQDASLGTWLYDKLHPEANQQAMNLVGPVPRGRVDGQVNINIAGLPPGSRVEPVSSGTMPMNLSAGYNGFATGMPF